MAKLFNALKKILGAKSQRLSGESRQPPRDSQFVGRSSVKDIEQASPERAGELAGHAVERVET